MTWQCHGMCPCNKNQIFQQISLHFNKDHPSVSRLRSVENILKQIRLIIFKLVNEIIALLTMTIIV